MPVTGPVFVLNPVLVAAVYSCPEPQRPPSRPRASAWTSLSAGLSAHRSRLASRWRAGREAAASGARVGIPAHVGRIHHPAAHMIAVRAVSGAPVIAGPAKERKPFPISSPPHFAHGGYATVRERGRSASGVLTRSCLAELARALPRGCRLDEL